MENKEYTMDNGEKILSRQPKNVSIDFHVQHKDKMHRVTEVKEITEKQLDKERKRISKNATKKI